MQFELEYAFGRRLGGVNLDLIEIDGGGRGRFEKQAYRQRYQESQRSI
jgi:hypothetical protein